MVASQVPIRNFNDSQGSSEFRGVNGPWAKTEAENTVTMNSRLVILFPDRSARLPHCSQCKRPYGPKDGACQFRRPQRASFLVRQPTARRLSSCWINRAVTLF